MPKYIKMNESQILGTLSMLQDSIAKRNGAFTLEQTISFLEDVIYKQEFNPIESLQTHIDEYLDTIGMEK